MPKERVVVRRWAVVGITVVVLLSCATWVLADAPPCFLPLLFRPQPIQPTPTLTSTCTLTPMPTATATRPPTATATITPTRTSYSDVRVVAWCSQFDAPGNDNDMLDEEYVCFQNHDLGAVDMAGWHVRDDSGSTRNIYTFGDFELRAGAHVQLHTGAGIDTATDLYWGRGQAVWNNDGDTVYLYDPDWNLVNSYSY